MEVTAWADLTLTRELQYKYYFVGVFNCWRKGDYAEKSTVELSNINYGGDRQ